MADHPGMTPNGGCAGVPEDVPHSRPENQPPRDETSSSEKSGSTSTDSGTEPCQRCAAREEEKVGVQTKHEIKRTSKRNDSSQMQSVLSYGNETLTTKSHAAHVERTCRGSPPCVFTEDTAGSSFGLAVDSRDKGKTTACSPLSELKKLPQCHVQLEKLYYSKDHTVLINVDAFSKGHLTAQKGQPKWNSSFVKMPNSDENTIQSGILKIENVRWGKIYKYLSSLPRTPSSDDVEKAIKKYNPNYKAQWSFDALHTYYKSLPAEEKEAVSTILRKVADLALKLPQLCEKAIPMLRQYQNHSITLSQLQIACLLANAFYCTFPHRNATHRNAEYANYPTINFTSLFADWSSRKREKFKALFNYFRAVTDPGSEKTIAGLVTFERCHLHTLPFWGSRPEKLTKLHVSSEGTIEDKGVGMLQVDFACSLVGGGILGNGLVQEEILFITHPELIVARLFTERLGDTECLKIIGCQQFSTYSGFSDSFRCTGAYVDNTERDEWMRRHRKIVAIDALRFRSEREQYGMKKVERELNKAFCGFKGEDDIPSDYLPAVATGNWGCGAFNGDPKLKALIQLMAAAVAQRDVAYFTFHNRHLESQLLRMHHFLTTHRVTVAKLFSVLESYSQARFNGKPEDLYRFIRSSIGDTNL